MANPKILIIDDDKTVVTAVSGALRAAGFQVIAAFDGAQGFMFANREVPDLILLDLNMPAGGGLGVWQRLRGSTRTLGIPVVFVSATAQPGFEKEALSQGAVGFVAKPVDLKALAIQVKGILGIA